MRAGAGSDTAALSAFSAVAVQPILESASSASADARRPSLPATALAAIDSSLAAA